MPTLLNLDKRRKEQEEKEWQEKAKRVGKRIQAVCNEEEVELVAILNVTMFGIKPLYTLRPKEKPAKETGKN